MKDCKTILLAVLGVAVAVIFGTVSVNAQYRDRVVKTNSSSPVGTTQVQPAAPPVEKVKSLASSRPVLTNKIIVVKPDSVESPMLKKTASTSAVGAGGGRSIYSAGMTSRLDQAIKSRYGLRYVYGSAGPNTYDCSGFVWSVFLEAGIKTTRTSARALWNQSDDVSDTDKYKFGNLVFLNRLGHVGIVADENGFYHASSSKGITYSKFAGYWAKRIVGIKKLRPESVIAID